MTATVPQVEALLDFLTCHKELARGYVHSVEGRARCKRLWEDISMQLNSMGGAIKTVQQWKKVWADRKYLAKRANSASRRSATATGGGPPAAEVLSDMETKIVSIMGPGFGQPDIPACSVPAFPEVATTDQHIPLCTESPIWEMPVVIEIAEEDLPASPRVNPIRTDPWTSPVSRPIRRRRTRPVQNDVHKHILNLERDKLNTMNGILGELKHLNHIMSEINKKI